MISLVSLPHSTTIYYFQIDYRQMDFQQIKYIIIELHNSLYTFHDEKYPNTLFCWEINYKVYIAAVFLNW
jgi:hypothetical protein